VEFSTSGTRRRQPIMSPSYLVRDWVRIDNVTVKRYGYEDLVCFDLSTDEEIQDSEPSICMEAVKIKEIFKRVEMITAEDG
jgi:hypothetical protein